MENKFKVKLAMLDKASNIVDELTYSIENLQNEYDNECKKTEDEYSWMHDSIMNDYPARIKAYNQIILHLEKLL